MDPSAVYEQYSQLILDKDLQGGIKTHWDMAIQMQREKINNKKMIRLQTLTNEKSLARQKTIRH